MTTLFFIYWFSIRGYLTIFVRLLHYFKTVPSSMYDYGMKGGKKAYNYFIVSF